MGRNARAAGGRDGFTLVEMLTVMAIVALVAALVFPVFARVRESGRQTVCSSSIRQIGNALELYRRQWDDFLPPVTSATDGTWKDAVFPFVSSFEVFRCPSNLGEELRPTHYDPAAPASQRFPASYALNVEPLLLAGGCRTLEPDPELLVQGWLPSVRQPDSTILLVENRIHQPYATPQDLRTRLLERLLHPRAVGRGLIQTHGTRSNWLFLDGHVASLPPKATLAPTYLWSERMRLGGVLLGGGSVQDGLARMLHPEYR